MRSSSKGKAVLVAAGIAGLGVGIFNASPARANTVLYTTASDFTGWGNGSTIGGTPTVVTTSAVDLDGKTVNGAGNNPDDADHVPRTPGATSPGGSLQISTGSGLGFNGIAFGPGEAFVDGFMHAIDPGSTTAFSAASGFGNGTTVAFSGNMLIDYTIPNFTPGTESFYQIGIILNYSNNFQQIVNPQTSTSLGGGVFQANIPYTINPTSLGFFSMGILVNSDNSAIATTPINIDDIEVVSAVPEPTSLGLIGSGALLLLRRKKTI